MKPKRVQWNDKSLWENPHKEVVLPTGQFAKIRLPRWEDVCVSWNQNVLMMATLLASRIVLIDEELMPVEWYFQLPGPQAAALMEHLNSMVQDSYKPFKYGNKL